MKVGSSFRQAIARPKLLPDEEEEDAKEAQKKLKEKFKPLIEWLKEETKDVVRDGESL